MRGRRPTLEDYGWKVVKLPPHVWEKLQYLASRDGEPIYRLIEAAVAEKYGLYSSPGDNYIPIWEALDIASRQLGKQISPYAVVTAIRKGAIGAERRKVGNRYHWFVDLTGLINYCSKRCSKR